MGHERLRYWMALGRLRGLEKFGLSALIGRFGGPEEVFREPSSGLKAFSPELADAVKGFDGWERVDKDLGLVDVQKVRVTVFSDPAYPALLREISDPPALLFSRGVLPIRGAPAIAVVGTRRPTHYGLKLSRDMAAGLASAGVAVVSGMARGCDTAAHRGALSVGGFTVAVLGTGIDVPYPRENSDLYGEICEKGLVVSEFPPGTPPQPYNFPKRNRIISGISRGVVVVEAPERSGSLMTARLALEENRDVYAVPGQALSAKSSGTNRLIKDGAALVECAEDVLDSLSLLPLGRQERRPAPTASELSEEERRVFLALGTEPLHIDDIIEATGLAAQAVSSTLLQLELKGFARQVPGKSFLRA